jgi:hypothetical protein
MTYAPKSYGTPRLNVESWCGQPIFINHDDGQKIFKKQRRTEKKRSTTAVSGIPQYTVASVSESQHTGRVWDTPVHGGEYVRASTQV